jgi:GxxExxY protein
MMNGEEIVRAIIDQAIDVHKIVGPGMLETVYKKCLSYRLLKNGLYVETEVPIPVYFEDVKMDCGYRGDIVVEKEVVIEVKSIEAIGPLQIAQTLTYLRFLKLRYGLILNFNALLMKQGIKRVLNGY